MGAQLGKSYKGCLRKGRVEVGCSYFFFFIFEAEMFLICYLPDWTFQCHKEECQTEYNKNTLFHFFQAAHIGSHWEVFCKKSILQKTSQKIPAKEFNYSSRLQVCKFTKLNSFTGIFHRFWTQMQLYTL